MPKEKLYSMFGFNEEEIAERDKHMSERRAKFMSSADESWSRRNSKLCVEFYTSRGYTEEDARREISELQKLNSIKVSSEQKKQNSPISEIYYTQRGFTKEEAAYLVSEEQKKRSKRCVEYWLNLGHSLEESKKLVREYQNGHIGNKSQEEKLLHYKTRRAPRINIKNLRNSFFEDPGMVYVVNIRPGKYKIGITVNNVKKRYGMEIKGLEYREYPCVNITKAWEIECYLKETFEHTIKKQDYGCFGWTEVIEASSFEEVESIIKRLRECNEDTRD